MISDQTLTHNLCSQHSSSHGICSLVPDYREVLIDQGIISWRQNQEESHRHSDRGHLVIRSGLSLHCERIQMSWQ